VTTNLVPRLRVGVTRELATGIGITVLLAGCSTASPPPPPTWDGLVKQPALNVDALYVSPAASLTAYRTVLVDPPVVSFDENWHFSTDISPSPAKSPMSPAEVAGLKNALSDAFLGIFEQELATCGYVPVKQAGADTLHVSPGLADVYLNTPPGTMLTWKQYMGRMILVMELRDGPTGRLLARVVDEEVGDFGMLESPNTVLNSMDFRRTVQGWARTLPACQPAANGNER
jgi:hypothetical protein